jgi:hypothetical protein
MPVVARVEKAVQASRQRGVKVQTGQLIEGEIVRF